MLPTYAKQLPPGEMTASKYKTFTNSGKPATMRMAKNGAFACGITMFFQPCAYSAVSSAPRKANCTIKYRTSANSVDIKNANGISFAGFFASPAKSPMIRKPHSVNTMPPMDSAAKILCTPPGMNPSPLDVRLALSNLVNINTNPTLAGMAIFHHVITLFMRINQRTPKKFSTVKNAISNTVAT